jgi:phosphate transport system substrate-binding protein
VSDGSSTVDPLTQADAEEFNAHAPDVQISVDISGTGGGFKRVCEGETDVQNASRPIEDDERATCAENGVDWYQFEVAYDGITVVVNPENTWLTCVSTDDLGRLWQKDNPAQTWADLNPNFPSETVDLYRPVADSGTFDLFVEAILGERDVREDAADIEQDADAARRIVARDDDVAALYEHVYRELLTAMLADPTTINRATHLLWVGHNLERIADRATNICERVVFAETAELTEIKVSTYWSIR